jgi:hypothetical protein
MTDINLTGWNPRNEKNKPETEAQNVLESNDWDKDKSLAIINMIMAGLDSSEHEERNYWRSVKGSIIEIHSQNLNNSNYGKKK